MGHLTTYNLAECALFHRAKDIAQSMSRVEFLEGIVRMNDMEESKRSEALSPIVDSLLVRIRQAAKEALEEPDFRRIHDANSFAWLRSIRPGYLETIYHTFYSS